ncbi:hypothetical protein BX666DRAFT_1160224 [Dichotomocladium elegans]|nr:hypothetical protein BX666DRAFT_1160224 [Dichotomocladium elegans]
MLLVFLLGGQFRPSWAGVHFIVAMHDMCVNFTLLDILPITTATKGTRIDTYNARSRRSYSYPSTTSSSSFLRSFLSRDVSFKDTSKRLSSSSSHAGLRR